MSYKIVFEFYDSDDNRKLIYNNLIIIKIYLILALRRTTHPHLYYLCRVFCTFPYSIMMFESIKIGTLIVIISSGCYVNS